jgi:hypothetical protein
MLKSRRRRSIVWVIGVAEEEKLKERKNTKNSNLRILS